MRLALWRCDQIECTRTCTGAGGAVGLRAIGWYFQPGDETAGDHPQLYCPEHRPDPIDCKQRPGTPCSHCAAERDVRIDQPKLMSNPELDHYVRKLLPIMQRMDLDLAVRAAEGRPIGVMDHHPPALCEHGVWQYGGCINADCHNCADNLFPAIPLAPPEYRPGIAL